MPPKSFVFYRGPSVLDGAPIIGTAVASRSRNEKTGAMVQTFIMRADMGPSMAVKIGADASICGACPHTGKHDAAGNLIPKTRTCYVVLHHAPRSVHEAFTRGVYDDLTTDLDAAAERIRGRAVRLGTYGDPAAVPLAVWTAMLAHADGLTGYTHQWRATRRSLLTSWRHATATRIAPKPARWASGRSASPARRAGRKQLVRHCARQAPKPGRKPAASPVKPAADTAPGPRADIVIPAHGNGKKLIG